MSPLKCIKPIVRAFAYASAAPLALSTWGRLPGRIVVTVAGKPFYAADAKMFEDELQIQSRLTDSLAAENFAKITDLLQQRPSLALREYEVLSRALSQRSVSLLANTSVAHFANGNTQRARGLIKEAYNLFLSAGLNRQLHRKEIGDLKMVIFQIAEQLDIPFDD